MSTARKLVDALSSSTLLHVTFAFVVMGGWAMFANAAHSLGEAARAGLVQGLMSAAITLSLKKALDALNRRFDGWVALVAPPLIACSFSLAALIVVHLLFGTPEIARTIAIPFAVAFTYACLYNFKLWKAR